VQIAASITVQDARKVKLAENCCLKYCQRKAQRRETGIEVREEMGEELNMVRKSRNQKGGFKHIMQKS